MRKVDNSVSSAQTVSFLDEEVMDLLTEEEILKIAGKLAGKSVRPVDYELSNKNEVHGYLGKHLTLTLNLPSEGGIQQRRLFLKTYEVKPDSEDFLGETGIFRREQDFYRVFVQDIKEFFGRPDWCPECLFNKQRVIVLEDLTEEGFKMVEHKEGQWALDAPHLEAALKALASMHATSFLLEYQESKSLPAMYPTVFGREMLYDESKPEASTRKWIMWQIHDLLEGINYLDKYSHNEKTQIRNNFQKEIMRIYALSKKSVKYRNVLTHGDMWRNNLLFRYSDENSPEVCKLVDFQFIRYAPPAHDVMHLLHYATKKETRDRMESRYLQIYYENLRKRGKDGGLDIEVYVTENEFLESCKVYKELALIQSLLSLHYILGPVTLTVETKSYQEYEDYLNEHRKEYMGRFFQKALYADKITDIFCELVDSYILQ